MPAAQQINLAQWQEHFDFLLPKKEFLRGDEVADALDADERTAIRLFDDQQLMGHEFNAAKGHRQHRRYRRSSIILFLAKSANYTPSDLRDRLMEVVATLPRSDKAFLYQRLGESLRNA
ncbi:MAG: hypothetical protein WC378_05270 [Opitutaceae bacterium]|jgi:hypothetical protein